MGEEEWITVYTTPQMHEALFVQAMLREYNIESVLLNQQDSTGIVAGFLHVKVKLYDAAEAMIAINQWQE
jgi:hypothetical protein